jgi:hypothetical protein
MQSCGELVGYPPHATNISGDLSWPGLIAWHRANEVSRRLATIPGIGSCHRLSHFGFSQ